MSGASSTFGAAPLFDQAVVAAEQARQQVTAAIARAYTIESGPQVAADIAAISKAAEVAKFKTLLAAATASGCSTSVFMQALHELGVQ